MKWLANALLLSLAIFAFFWFSALALTWIVAGNASNLDWGRQPVSRNPHKVETVGSIPTPRTSLDERAVTGAAWCRHTTTSSPQVVNLASSAIRIPLKGDWLIHALKAGMDGTPQSSNNQRLIDELEKKTLSGGVENRRHATLVSEPSKGIAQMDNHEHFKDNAPIPVVSRSSARPAQSFLETSHKRGNRAATDGLTERSRGLNSGSRDCDQARTASQVKRPDQPHPISLEMRSEETELPSGMPYLSAIECGHQYVKKNAASKPTEDKSQREIASLSMKGIKVGRDCEEMSEGSIPSISTKLKQCQTYREELKRGMSGKEPQAGEVSEGAVYAPLKKVTDHCFNL